MGVGQHTCPVSAAGGLASRGFLEMTHGKNPTAVEHFQENPVGTCFCPLHLTPHLETLPGAKGNKRSTAGKAGSRQKAENYFPPLHRQCLEQQVKHPLCRCILTHLLTTEKFRSLSTTAAGPALTSMGRKLDRGSQESASVEGKGCPLAQREASWAELRLGGLEQLLQMSAARRCEPGSETRGPRPLDCNQAQGYNF